MLNRLLIVGLVALLLMALTSVVWNLCDQPPPRLILKYGFPPTGGPTGRIMIIEGVEFVELKPGYFRMGSHFLCQKGDLLGRVCAVLRLPWGKKPRHTSNECPPRWVEIEGEFWIARTEVTNAQYDRFPHVPGLRLWGDSEKTPVTGVSITWGRYYCAWLSERCGYRVRLPTEAQWEFACRAGSASEYCFGDDGTQLDRHAWVRNPRRWCSPVLPVGLRRANDWGLFDMHGNALELCEGPCWQDEEYPAPSTPTQKREGILRGGCVDSVAGECRCASRLEESSAPRFAYWGFRPILCTGSEE